MNIHSGSVRISALFLSIVFFCGICGFCFLNLGKWLIVSDSPDDRMNVIFTFAGENARITYSKYLFRKNPESLWIISYPSIKIKSVLNHDNLDTSRIIVVDTCTDTKAEVSYILQWQRLHARQLARQTVSGRTPVIGLVSSWYHMRRIKLLLDSQSKKESCSVRFLPAQINDSTENKPENTWWKNSSNRHIVLSEWGKLLYLYCSKAFKQS